MRISSQDKPFINADLKTLDRRKQREYTKNGKTLKYNKLKEEFVTKFKAAAGKYIRTKVDDLKEAKPGRAFAVLKSMGAQPGDCSDDQTFILPNHQDQNLSDQQCAESIAEHFAAISKEYSALNKDQLPTRVQTKLEEQSKLPTISEYECYLKLKATKKPRSVIPGDLPSEIVKEFTEELAYPLAKICNKIVQSATWPLQWKVEHVIPISKIPLPQTEDDLRPISLTSFFSKVMEQFIVMWLLELIGGKMDFRQYGGMKGNSTCHYLIELINFILYHQNNLEPTSVLACLVDFSKAFNQQDQNILITKLSDLGVPGWLLKLVMAFLSDRTMRVKYKNKYSGLFSLPGGGPQGTLLGLFLFLVLINDVGFSEQENNAGELITCKKRFADINVLHLKYVDDLLLAESINMNTQVEPAPLNKRPQPDPYRARTGHQLLGETSKVLSKLEDTKAYADANKMKINFTKTKAMLFNPCHSKDFLPKFDVDGIPVEMVEQTKLLGVVLSSDLSWSAHTNYMVERCNKKMWVIRRLKKLGADNEDLLEVYSKQIRSILEYAVPVWNSSLTGADISKLERIQKTVLHIVLGQAYTSYSQALKVTGTKKLSERRKKLCLSFGSKAQKHAKFSKWFKVNSKQSNTRQKQPKFCQVIRRTDRLDIFQKIFFCTPLNINFLSHKYLK